MCIRDRRGKGKVAPPGRYFGAVAVADNPAAAAHVGNLVAIFAVKAAVHKAEGGIHPACRYFQGQPVKIVVRIFRVKVDPLFDPEDQIGKDGALSAAQAAVKGLQNGLGNCLLYTSRCV